MIDATYSPTIVYSLRLDQNFWQHMSSIFSDRWDCEGYDCFGYDKSGRDRAWHRAGDYQKNPELYDQVKTQFKFLIRKNPLDAGDCNDD